MKDIKTMVFRKITAVLLSTMMILTMTSCGTTQVTKQVNEASDRYINIDRALADNVSKYHVPAMAVMEVSSDEILFSGCYGECTGADQDFII